MKLKLTKNDWLHRGFGRTRQRLRLGLSLLCLAASVAAAAQAPTTTTVQGTVYLASGQPGSGTLVVSWPAFTTASGQVVAADKTTVTIPSDGFVSVNLAPNLGATPAGLFYTAVYYMSDGTTSTQYWVVPAAANASLAQVQSQVMPAAQAVQAVSKAYVDQAISEATLSGLTASGGTLTGPLYLSADPTQPLQAADKHYVDITAGTLQNNSQGTVDQVDLFSGADFGAKLQACLSTLSSSYGGTCDARNFSSTQSMASNLTISTSNATILLPCATISTAHQWIVTAGARNVSLRGCALRGASAASGSQGGTVFLYSGAAAAIKVGDPTYAVNTSGFHLDNAVINTTASSSATAQALVAYRTQEIDLESLYLLGNQNQTGITLDGTGNYTGGTFFDDQIDGFQTAVNAIGHQISNPATTDWMNASAFVRLHIDCPESSGSPISGTYGINLQQGDGNTFTGGDVEGCSTALHLGANAQNNTIVGLRNEVSTNQVVADSGSSYNSWITGGTMFTGALTDNGTRNSFLDTFHRSFNGLSGDWYGSQQDATVTNHYRIGTGAGNERGLLNRYQTDYGYRWTTGLSDATAGEQFYQILDELNGIYRLSIGQYNNGSSSTNNQTVINSAGSGAIVLNGSTNAGVGGVVFGSGGSSETTVATIGNTGNALFNGTLQVGGTSTFVGSTMVKNQLDAEIDQFLQAGLTTSQKESLTYKDWNGNSQWYMVKDQSNNWALNSATGGLDSFKAYQSTNSGDTYIDTSNSTGVVRVNYETGSGTAFNIYGGSSSALYASFTGTTAIKFPGLAAGSGHNCLQVDNSGFLSNTGSACGSGSGGSGTVGSGTSGQIAYYTATGTTVGGISSVPISAGGTGSATAAGALVNLGAEPISLTGSSAPSSTCSSTVNNGVFYTSSAPSLYQCSNVTGVYQWNAVGGSASGSPAVTYNMLSYGAVADAEYTASASIPAGSNVLFDAGSPFTSAAVGKWVVLTNENTAPAFSTLPYNIAQITSYVDSAHVGLSKTNTNSATETFGYFWGTDNVPAAIACQSAVVGSGAAYKLAGAGTCTWPAGRYLLATSPYTVEFGAYDDGSYGTPAGGSGGTISCTVSGSAPFGLSSCTASGGSGYPVSATMQTNITGGCGYLSYNSNIAVYGNGTCGYAWVTVSTNSSGNLSSATVVYPGYNFQTAPTVTPIALGGDGAAATTSVSSGAFTTPAVTAGGSGYPASVTNIPWFAIGGTGCATQGPQYNPGVNVVGSGTASTNAAGAVTGAAIVQNTTGCTSAPKIVFGSYPCWDSTNSTFDLQCQNVAPLNPIAMPTQIPVASGVSWRGTEGQSAVLISNWDGISDDNNESILFGASAIDGLTTISGLSINQYFIGIGDQVSLNDSSVHGNLFGTGAIGQYNGAVDVFGQIYDNTYFSQAPIVNGGGWTTRQDYPQIGGGFNNSQREDTFQIYPTYNANLDKWFDQYVWGGPYSKNSQDFLETCASPLAANQRQTGHSFNSVYSGNTMCYPGASGSAMLELLRNDNLGSSSHNVGGITAAYASRYLYYGALATGTLSNSSCCNGGATLSTDPYRSASVQHAGIVTLDSSGLVDNVGFGAGGSIAQTWWELRNSGATPPGIPKGSWRELIGSNQTAQPAVENVDNYVSTDGQGGQHPPNFIQGLSIGTQTGVGINGGATFLSWPYGVMMNGPTGSNLALFASNGSSFYEPLSVASLTDSGLTSAAVVATSSAGLLQSASTSGTGAVALVNGPTFTGNMTTFANGAAAEQDVVIQPGTGADQIGAFEWNSYSGTAQWKFRKDASNYLRLTDVVNSLDREVFFQNGQTILNAGAGANAAVVNGSTGSGTGGLLVENGGSSPAAVLTVTGGGNTTATGFLSGKFLMGTGTMTLTAGAASGTGPTIACVSSHVCDGVSGTVTLTTGTSTTTGTLATLGFPNTHTNQANCVVSPTLSGTGLVTSITWSESTTALTLTANTALTASTAYQIRYWCGGN
jgi:hypothetical protein